MTFAADVRSDSYVEIGTLIESGAEMMVDEWCARAVEDQPAARRVHADVLKDHLIVLLRAVGRALRQPGDSESHKKVAVVHGEQRWDSGWSLVEVVRDYQLLRVVVLDYLESVLERPLLYREAMAIGVFIDDAIATSVEKFAAHRENAAVRSVEARAQTLEEANRRKEEFLAVLGHELRNPIAPIATSIRIIRTTVKPQDAVTRQSIDVIERQTAQLGRIVDDMLDLARIGQGRLELHKSRLTLANVIDQAAATVAPVMNARNHMLHVDRGDRSLEIEADAARLVQIITNLLNNAAKYTPEGSHIFLSSHREGQNAVIRVRDTGIGIPADMLGRIFELFTQVDGSQQYAAGGLGIGLALVKRLVEQHGGSVACHSPGPGKGSEFFVRLPLADAY